MGRQQGEQIPLATRIFAIIDVWDALNSDRPYRARWSTTEARDYIIYDRNYNALFAVIPS
jgi:response regulator RpfG family c-di-GMP phosphodiesterase